MTEKNGRALLKALDIPEFIKRPHPELPPSPGNSSCEVDFHRGIYAQIIHNQLVVDIEYIQSNSSLRRTDRAGMYYWEDLPDEVLSEIENLPEDIRARIKNGKEEEEGDLDVIDKFYLYDDDQEQYARMTQKDARDYWKRAEKNFAKDERIDALARKFQKLENKIGGLYNFRLSNGRGIPFVVAQDNTPVAGFMKYIQQLWEEGGPILVAAQMMHLCGQGDYKSVYKNAIEEIFGILEMLFELPKKCLPFAWPVLGIMICGKSSR
ncbi:hypothetical protein CL633_03660 [bacterium]|nr:hypothetical protein [bacterium]|tara:strand:+ start:3096 stop:3890 length:795 start_codon:yes stop_codon:yes gene_type:complete